MWLEKPGEKYQHSLPAPHAVLSPREGTFRIFQVTPGASLLNPLLCGKDSIEEDNTPNKGLIVFVLEAPSPSPGTVWVKKGSEPGPGTLVTWP